MTLKDDDWINLLAGETVDGVDEKEKKLVEAMRKHLLKDQGLEIEVSDDSLAKEREQLLNYWDENLGRSEKTTSVDSIPVTSSKVVQLSRFKRVFIPFAAAASVAMLAVTLVLRDPYPDWVDGYSGERGVVSTKASELLIETTDPKAVYKKLKKSFATNEVLYRFSEEATGWKVTFFVTSDNIEYINQVLSQYTLEVKDLGDSKLIIRKKVP